MDISVGDYIVITRGRTIVDGEVTGWLVSGGELIKLFIDEIDSPFVMFGENPWKVVIGEETDEIQY